MRSTLRKIIVSAVAASFVFATMPLAEVSAQKQGKGGRERGGGGERGGQQRQQRSNEQRGGERQQRPQMQGRSNDQRGQQRQQQMQARQQQQMQQRQQDWNGQRQRGSDRISRQQQVRSDQESRRQQQMSDRVSRRQQWESDRRSREQQVRSDRGSRRQQQISDQYSGQQQRLSDARSRNGGLWQGFPQDKITRDGDNDRRDRGNDRARWNRGYSGTPIWANRNYSRPAENRYRREVRREGREDRRWEREARRSARDYGRFEGRSYRDAWSANIFPTVNWNDDYDRSYGRRSYRSDRYYSQVNNYYPYSGYNNYVYVVTQPYYSSAYSGYGQNYGGYGQIYYPNGYYDAGYSDYGYADYGNGYDYNYDDAYYGNDYGYGDQGDWKSALLRTVLSLVLGGSGDNFDNNYYATDPSYAYSGYSPVYAPGGYYTSQPNWIYSPATYDATPYSDSPYSSMIYAEPYTREVAREALAAGYSQGFIDGQNAASYGYSDYSSPYGYAPTAYSGYSTSLAERQQYLSEGYELGRRDAIKDRDSYGIFEGGGNLDLISALLGTVMTS